MFNTDRKKVQGIVTWSIIIVIGLAFASTGLMDYFSFGGSSQIAAKVNGEKISWRAVDALYDRMQRQMGDRGGDARTMKDQLRYALAQRTALLSSAKALGFVVGDEQIARTLLQIPAFQVDGQFSKERYNQVLQDASYNDVLFRHELAQDVLLGQLEQGFAKTSFSLNDELARMVELIDQRRDIGYMTIPVQKFKAGIQISKEDIQKHYDENKSSFVIPEMVSLQYVELSLDDLAKDVAVNDEELQNYYNDHKGSYSAPERIHARHILIPINAAATAKAGSGNANQTAKNADESAKAKAEDIMAQLQKGGNFEALAKEHSADTGSAENGGDLGWFARGQMVPEFEQAAFTLRKANSITGPVKTAYGYHIIQLLEYKPAETRSFADVRSLVKEQLQRERAQANLADKGEQMAKLAFENASSLTPIMEQLGLKLKETAPFSRQGGQQDSINSNPAVIQAAFSEEVLKQGQNSEPIKIGDNSIVVIRMKSYTESKQQTLAEVEKSIQDKLILQAAADKAQEASDKIEKALAAGGDPNTIAKDNALTWKIKSEVSRNSTDSERTIIATAFQTPKPEAKDKPGVRSVKLPTGDYLVMAVNKVQDGDIGKIDAATRLGYRQSLADVYGQIEFALYATRTVNQAKIEMSGQAPN